MLSAAELKRSFFMPSEGSFRPLIHALGSLGSLPSTPVAFLDIGFDDLGLSELQRALLHGKNILVRRRLSAEGAKPESNNR